MFTHTRFTIVLILACLLLAACSSGAQPTATLAPTNTSQSATQAAVTLSDEELIASAHGILDAMVAGDFETATANFDATMLRMVPPETLELNWQQLNKQLGALKERSEGSIESKDGYRVVSIICDFEKSTLDLRTAYDQQGRVAGLFFAAPETSTPEGMPTNLPAYIKPDQFTEQEVTVGSGEWALPGTLTLPKGEGPFGEGPFPAVVLVHGSGPNDRDETIGPSKPFRDLAWGLASQGVAVLRYEKRTKQHAMKFTEEIMQNLTVKEETIDDALAAVALLRQTQGIDPQRIYVLGHSLGGMLIPRIGSQDTQIAGLIVLAGPTRPLEELYLEQVTYIFNLDGTLSDDEKSQLAQIEAQVATLKSEGLSVDTPSDALPMGVPANYWLDLKGYQPAEMAKTLSQPMLILQGERDYQVTTADFEGWKAALADRSDVEFKLYPDLNHLFITGEGKSQPVEYQLAGYVSEQVIVDIAGWVSKH